MQSMFIDSNEKQQAVLGGGYLRNFLSSGTIDKGFCVVTDKRVYFRGKCYYRSGDNIRSYKAVKEERTVDLKDVTGTGFTYGNLLPLFVKILMILDILFFAWQGILGLSMYDEIYHKDNLSLACWLLFEAVVVLGVLIFCYVRKSKIFEVSYAGGKIAFKASNYNEEEMRQFQKDLRMAKDNFHPETVAHQTVSNSTADELKKAKDLLDSGAITLEEYEQMKKKVLGI